MKTIRLTHGKITLVDDEDYEELSKHRWYFDHLGYAARNSKKCDNMPKRKTIFLHRVVAKTISGMHTDHINGDRLDNRKSNLRACTNAQNRKNMKMHKNNSLGFKGIRRHGKKFQAVIQNEKKFMCLGTFTTKEEAATAYNIAAIKYHGEFANLNNI